jgi:hypothetical protein
MKNIVAVAVFGVLALFTVQAQDSRPQVTLTVQEIASQAQFRNLEIFKAARNVEKARKDLIGEPELKSSSLSVGGGYATSGLSAGGWYGESSLSLRLLPQLSAAASAALEESWEFSESLSLTVRPLEPSRQTYSEERVLASAVVRERYLKHGIYLAAEEAALDLLVSDMERELARATVELEQRKYELARRRQEVGETSFQDVQDQLLDLIEARQDQFTGEQRFLGDWRTLQLLFAPSEEWIAVAPMSAGELLALVERRRGEVKRLEQAVPATEALENLRLDLDALEAELKATPVWRPELSLSTAVSLPYAYPESHSVSISMSLSPDQLKGEDRVELQQDIEVKRMEIEAETSAAGLQQSLELQNIALTEQALASAQVQMERDRVALREAELLFQQGLRTTLELEQLRLNLERSRILTFDSAVEVYGFLGAYLLLFVKQ